ncbi:acetolactate synthase-1/2/3 large subunit [Brevibacterium iodinum ATCC 49514]|uniref:Acetolactate synthase-1/2/3 large subunit n=1 Tax=Brevibacterium iodinum ATCC 49514 TaxID=1255616 RepID=A0A2H1KHI2_9MICO|nr:thiamine pyrophosphate-binding protein [Brevibacterium iodinum]SMX98642.1 acetolactate synthase-1/2/3 large subunit [Brevibacterium iodinum ATCC 49514]SUW12989.1 Acetolactate synthase isozyme 3 large subunit [Brevibacterium iodinum]
MVDLTGGAHLARALKAEGITRVFGIPGTHNLEIFAQLSAHGIDIVSPRHEQGAGYMADGAARSTGEVNVVVTTTGPAVLNALTALLQSFTDSVPVLLICPGMPLTHPGRGNGLLHEVRDQAAALRAVLTEVHRVTSPGEVSLAVGQTLTAMRAGRTRPAAIEIPLDLIEATGPGSLHPSIARPLPTADPHAVDTAAEAVAEAQRPFIIAGAGARSAGPALLDLAETLGAGIILSSNAKGIIDDSEPLCLGAVGVLDSLPELLDGADAVIAIGTELAPSDFWPEPLPLPETVVRIDIDEVQMLTNAEVTHPILADAASATTPLVNALRSRRSEATTRAVADWAEQKKAAATSAAEAAGRPWADLCAALNSFTGSADSPVIVAADSTMACYYGVQTGWSARAGDRFLYPAGAGTLGYGLPAGIGAKLATASARVIAIEGDGGSMFTIAELAAAVQAQVQVTLVIVDNGGYGEIRNEMADRGDEPSGVVLAGPDFPALARAMGARGVHVDGEDALLAALHEADDNAGPTLIHITERSRAGEAMLPR